MICYLLPYRQVPVPVCREPCAVPEDNVLYLPSCSFSLGIRDLEVSSGSVVLPVSKADAWWCTYRYEANTNHILSILSTLSPSAAKLLQVTRSTALRLHLHCMALLERTRLS